MFSADKAADAKAISENKLNILNLLEFLDEKVITLSLFYEKSSMYTKTVYQDT